MSWHCLYQNKQVGGFILVVSGNLWVTGCTFTATFLFITVLGVGNFLSMMAGNAVVTGTVFTLNGGFVAVRVCACVCVCVCVCVLIHLVSY